VSGLEPAAVLRQDAQLLVVNKPAGRLVIPGRGRDESSLVEELSAVHGRLWVVHRLDRGTTGVLVFARSAAAHRALNLAFDRGEPRKRYLALVSGTPPTELRVEVALAPARRGRMRPARAGDPRGKPSATVFRLVEAFPPRPWAGGSLSLVEALPETGRTHQIRVHLAHAHHPLAVDPDYGSDEPVLGPDGRTLLERTPLHASRLELAHPDGGQPVVLEAPLPADMAAALEALRTGA
jgi:tRNA pseudouridine32 synthase / 23S rRNA pseudouridine746 synthase